MISTIHTVADVEAFFQHLINKESLNFHPDEDFRNYINLATHLPSYTLDEANLRNELMDACFGICEIEGVDIYNIGIELLFEKLK
jgi:hypothetical protein